MWSFLKSAIFLLCATASQIANAACYTIYMGNVIVYQSSRVPVDMSFQFSQTVPVSYGVGATMVFQEGPDICEDIDGSKLSNTPNELRISSQANAGSRNPSYKSASASYGQSQSTLDLIKDSPLISGAFERFTNSDIVGSNNGSQGYIQTGPRGGKYYINSSGNKSYIPQSGRK